LAQSLDPSILNLTGHSPKASPTKVARYLGSCSKARTVTLGWPLCQHHQCNSLFGCRLFLGRNNQVILKIGLSMLCVMAILSSGQEIRVPVFRQDVVFPFFIRHGLYSDVFHKSNPRSVGKLLRVHLQDSVVLAARMVSSVGLTEIFCFMK
jgi:hypothetical protein